MVVVPPQLMFTYGHLGYFCKKKCIGIGSIDTPENNAAARAR